ncbi:MAG: hypothetical protein HUJ75_02950, partial [Parasporobacterium sp.]|nr:hypothetical protein [Parasporobacterium sp.]
VSIFDDSDANETNNITVSIAAGAVDVFINTFTNTDSVPAAGAASTGKGNDVITVSATSGNVKNGSVSIYSGYGNDTVSIDTILGNAAEKNNNTAEIVVDGGEGLDTIKLVGELYAYDSLGQKILMYFRDRDGISDEGQIHLKNANGKTLVIKANGFLKADNQFRMLDRMYNKNTIEIVDLKTADGKYDTFSATDPLYAYIEDANGNIVIFDYNNYINASDPSKNLAYTNIVFDLDDYFDKHREYVTDHTVYLPSFKLGINAPSAATAFNVCQLTISYTGRTVGGGRDLVVNDIEVVGMPLLINASRYRGSGISRFTVSITGTIKAPDISVVVFSSDSLEGVNINGESIDVNKDPDATNLNKIFDSVVSFGVVGEAIINVSSTGKLIADSAVGIVDLSTEIDYTRPMLELLGLLEGLNVANVRFTTSKIDIMGELSGNIVRANAKSTVKLLAKNDLAQVINTLASAVAIPVGVSVGFVETIVNLHGKDSTDKAVIKAGSEFTMGADSDIKVITAAGSASLPVSIAVTVIDSTVSASVGDNAVVQKNTGTSEPDVIFIAKGNVDINTTAYKGLTDKGSSGGYAALTIATQKVTADITGSAQITAKSLSQSASSTEKITNKATSARPGEEQGGAPAADAKGILQIVLPMLKSVWESMKTKITDTPPTVTPGGYSTSQDAKNDAAAKEGLAAFANDEKKRSAEAKSQTAQESLDSESGTKVDLQTSNHGTISASAYKVKAGDT